MAQGSGGCQAALLAIHDPSASPPQQHADWSLPNKRAEPRTWVSMNLASARRAFSPPLSHSTCSGGSRAGG